MGQLTIDLQTFTVIKKHDIDRDNPYLWIVGIKLDRDAGLVAVALVAGTRQNLDDTGILITRDPCVGNLGDKFKKGESRTIPDSLGRISVPINLMAGNPATFSLLVTAMEHSTTSRATQQAAYNSMVDAIEAFIMTRMRNFNTTAPTPSELATLQADIRTRIINIFKPNPLSDNFIAAQQCDFSLGNNAFSRTVSLRFTSERGGTDYSISGTASYTV